MEKLFLLVEHNGQIATGFTFNSAYSGLKEGSIEIGLSFMEGGTAIVPLVNCKILRDLTGDLKNWRTTKGDNIIQT